jgi:hypothetical protein
MTEMNVAARGAFDFQLLVPFTKYATDLGFPPGDISFSRVSSLSHSLHDRLGTGEPLWGVHPTDLKVVLGIKIPDTGNLKL